MTANFPSLTVAPETLPMIAPASDTPLLEICSVPKASVEAAALERSASNCLISLLGGAEENTLGGGGGLGEGGRTVGGGALVGPALERPLVCVRSSTAKPSPTAAGASCATA